MILCVARILYTYIYSFLHKFFSCCSDLLRRPAEHVLLARPGAGAAVALYILRHVVVAGRSGIVDTAATLGGNVGVNRDVVVIVGSGGRGGSEHGDDGVPRKPADAATTT